MLRDCIKKLEQEKLKTLQGFHLLLKLQKSPNSEFQLKKSIEENVEELFNFVMPKIKLSNDRL